MKVLLVGLGSMGKNHHRVLAELGHEVISVDNQNPNADFSSLPQALRRFRFDAAVVATPTSSHRSITFEICKTSVPILVEKPLGESLQDVEQVQQLALETRTRIEVGYVERFNPAVIALKRLLNANTLGKVLSASFTREGPPDHRPQSPVALDLLSHDLDLAANLFCHTPLSLAFTSTDEGPGAQVLNELTAWDARTSATELYFRVSKIAKEKTRVIRVVSESMSFDVDLMSSKLNIVGSHSWSAEEARAIKKEFERSLDVQEPLRRLHTAFLSNSDEASTEVAGLAGLSDAVLVHQGIASLKRLQP